MPDPVSCPMLDALLDEHNRHQRIARRIAYAAEFIPVPARGVANAWPPTTASIPFDGRPSTKIDRNVFKKAPRIGELTRPIGLLTMISLGRFKATP